MSSRAFPVAITGISAVSALGSSIADYEESYQKKLSKLSPDHFWAEKIPTVVGKIPSTWLELQLRKYPKYKLLNKIQSTACYLMEDLKDQTDLFNRYKPDRIGLSIATTTAGIDSWLARVLEAGENWDRSNPKEWFGPSDHGGILAECLLENFPIKGLDLTFSTACSSGALAVAQGFEMIQRGEVDACVVGGLDTLSSLTVHGFHSLQLVDMKPCRPFAPDRQGMNLGEGGAFFLLERTPAKKVFGYICGHGSSTDFYHMTQPDPSGKPMLRSMERALASASWSAEEIFYVNAHGTGTVANDKVEELAIKELSSKIKFESTKNLHGHCLAGAGALEVLLALIACKTETPNHKALSNSFGFGGHNVTLAVCLKNPGAQSSQEPSTEVSSLTPYSYHVEAGVNSKTPPKTAHPLWRRMTMSCKSVLHAKELFEERFGINLSKLALEKKVSFYFGTVFGEMEAALIVAEGILKPSVAVSPTAFQQSVHNAPVAYLMQSLQIDAPTVTITSGTKSFDKCMSLAKQDLKFGTCDVAIVISASEYHVPEKAGTDTAFCEFLMLTLDEPPKTPIIKKDLPAKDLIPHRAPILFVEKLDLLREDGSGQTAVTLANNDYLFKDDLFNTHWLCEVFAQVAGLVSRGTANFSSEPPVGFLLSIDDFSTNTSVKIRPNNTIVVEVFPVTIIPPLAKYLIVGTLHGTEIARATMKFYSDENAPKSEPKSFGQGHS